jgi:hypothetical protein
MFSSNSHRIVILERSASQIDGVTQCLWRGVEGPRRCISCPCCSELFDHRARQQDLLVVVIAGIAFLASSFANAVCRLRFTGTHSWEASGGIWFSVPPLWVVGLDDHCGCYCWNRLCGFILRKCSLSFLIHRHSFLGAVRIAFGFPPSLCGLSVQMTTAVAIVGIAFMASSFANAVCRF